MTTDLIIVPNQNPIELFKKDNVDDILKRIRDEVNSRVCDISTPAGRKEIASLAHRVAKTKIALDDMGKELVSGWKKQASAVDEERRRIRDELDALKETVRKPLTEWEEADDRRVQALQKALEDLAYQNMLVTGASVDQINAQIEQTNIIYAREWQEFALRADEQYQKNMKVLNEALASRIKYDQDQAELKRLREEEEQRAKERAEKEEAERIEKIKQEAADKAKKEAEDKAAAEAKAAQEKADRERREAEEKAENERKAKEAAEKQAADEKARADKAEADKIEAAKKAEADRIAAKEQADKDAKAAADKAAQDERDKQVAKEKADKDAADKREADKKHRGQINSEALAAIVVALKSQEDIEDAARAVVEAIARGQVPHVKISY